MATFDFKRNNKYSLMSIDQSSELLLKRRPDLYTPASLWFPDHLEHNSK